MQAEILKFLVKFSSYKFLDFLYSRVSESSLGIEFGLLKIFHSLKICHFCMYYPLGPMKFLELEAGLLDIFWRPKNGFKDVIFGVF